MDSYLEIAKKVLREARRPLSAGQILKIAYQRQLVPSDLYGRTQHKTMQARLSSDILRHRGKSEFCRTAPGRFFLRRLQADNATPARFRREYSAPLRSAQLGRYDVVAFSRTDLDDSLSGTSGCVRVGDVDNIPWCYRRLDEVRRDSGVLALRILVLLLDGNKVLLRRKRFGQPEDLSSRTAIGFEGVIRREDKSLFSRDKFGIVEAAQRTMADCLQVAPSILERIEPILPEVDVPLLFEQGDKLEGDDLIAIISLDCSNVPEVAAVVADRILFKWEQVPVRANDLDRFDRWSARIVADLSLQAHISERD